MGLTESEKMAGRAFRDERQAVLVELNRLDPPVFCVPVFIGIYRHLCVARENRSTAIELFERYFLSPKYPEFGVPEERFGFLYREGECRGCGQVARSDTGRLVDALVRPPVTGRVSRS